MGTAERISLKIQFEHLIAAIAANCPQLERLEFRWDREELRFSEKNQKAIDVLRTSCLKLKSLVIILNVSNNVSYSLLLFRFSVTANFMKSSEPTSRELSFTPL